MRTRIKICGVRDEAMAQAVVDAGADAVGLVLAEGSPRTVSAAQAGSIARALPAWVEPVGLFVDASVEEVLAMAAQAGLTTVQLHGREGPAAARQLADAGLRVLKAVALGADARPEDLAMWRGPGTPVRGLLWDAPGDAEAGGAPSGGSGKRADWSALADLGVARSEDGWPSMILAGGLTPENVGRAMARVRPYAVDVSSGVESARGVKDAERIEAFCAAVRRADAEREMEGSAGG